MIENYYQNFLWFFWKSTWTIEDTSIFQVLKNSSKHNYRPTMYVPKEYATYVGLFFDKKTHWDIKLLNNLTKEQQISFHQVRWAYDIAFNQLKRLVPNTPERNYLTLVQKTITRWKNASVHNEYQFFLQYTPTKHSDLIFYAQLWCKLLSFYCNYVLDNEKFTKALNTLEVLIEKNDDIYFKKYFSACIYRFSSTISYLKWNIEQAKKQLNLWLELIETIISANVVCEYKLFLLKELKRRLLIRLYAIDKENSSTLLKKLLVIDPYSEEIWFMVIKNTQTSLIDKIVNYKKWVTMKPLMAESLQEFIENPEITQLLELEKLFLLSKFWKVNHISTVIEFFKKNWFLSWWKLLADIFDEKSWLNVREQMFQQFLLGKKAKNDTKAYYKNNPLFALDAMKNQKSTKYSSNYLQRNVAYWFHKEVMEFIGKDKDNIYSWTIELIDKFKKSINQKHDYHRVLISLWLHLQVVKEKSLDDLIQWIDTIENIEELSVYWYLFTRLKPKINWISYDEIFDKKILELPTTTKNIRLKLVSIMRLLVNNAKDAKIIEQVELLVALWDKLIDILDSVKEISNFEKNLIKSRYYRGKGFLFQMRNEWKELLECMKLCEKYADICRDYKNKSTLESIQSIDNHIWCYESMSRTYFFLKNPELGLKYMKQIPLVDPYESKWRVQLWEILYKLSQFENAAWCFANAASLGPPLYNKSWYLLWETYKKLGKYELWYFCMNEVLNLTNVDRKLKERMLKESIKHNDYILSKFISDTQK